MFVFIGINAHKRGQSLVNAYNMYLLDQSKPFILGDTIINVSMKCDGYVSRIMRKPVFRISYQVQHKRGCTATEDGKRFEMTDLESRGIVLSM